MSNSTNVETNVVQMRFDNKNFEKNVNQTMKSLDELKKELNFDDSKKSFKMLEENAKKVDFSPLSKGIEKVQASFSFLDTFSATVYHRLSNRLIDIGKKITTGVSTEGIKSGFNEYELKMNSFKTIKASAGKDFTDSQINEYLEELNRYADKTIYSFSDMTNNIGKFTNAGVKLDAAVKAIKGISNEAAVSGANAEEASRAMYNFSQALSAGYVKLIDWKSIENANMATEEFKTQLLETAAELKTVTKTADGMYKTIKKGTTVTSTKNFNEALSEQWLTTEVLTKTLAKYADETTEIGKKAFEAAQKVNTFTKLMDTLKEAVQSGWSQTWEIVIGDLEEATKLWTAISDKIGGVIDAFFKEKKAVLENWKAHNGRERTLRALSKILWNIGNALRIVGEAWRSVFPKTTVNNMMALTEALESIANKTRMTKDTSAALKDTFKGLFATIGILLEAFKAFKATFGKFFVRVLADALHTLFGVSGSLGQMLVSVKKSITENRTFYKVFKSIVDVLEWVYSGLKVVTNALWNFAKTVGSVVKDNGGFKAFKGWFDGLKKSITSFDLGGVASSIVGFIKGLWKIIDKTFEKTFNFYKPFKKKIDEVKTKIANSKVGQWIIGFYQDIVNGVQKVFNSFGNVKTDGIDKMNNNAKRKFSVFEKIVNFFKKVWEVVKGIALTIWPIIKGVVKSIGTGIQMLWEGVTENLKNSDLGDTGGLLAGGGLLALGIAIKKFIDNMKPMFSVVSMLGGKHGILRNIFKVLETATKFIKAKILKEIAVSLLMLVGAIFLLCTLPQEKVVAATATMGVLFQGITSVFKSIDGAGEGEESGKGAPARLFGVAAMLLALASAMVVLTIAMKKIGSMDVEQVTAGTIMIGVLLRMISSTVNSILSMGQRLRGSKAGAVTIQAAGVAGIIKALGTALLKIMIAIWILANTIKSVGLWPVVGASVIIGAVLVAIGRVIQTIVKYTSKSDALTIKGLGVLSSAALTITMAFLIEKFAKAMALILTAIAALATLISNEMIDNGSFIFSASMFIVILGAVIGMIASVAKIGESADFTHTAKIVLMVGVITLFIHSMAILVSALSLLPNSWAMTGLKVILGIAAGFSLIMLALSSLLKNYEMSYVNVKGIATIMASITLAILAISVAMGAISNAIGTGSSKEVILTLLGIAAGIAGIILAIGKFNTVARGVKIFSNGMAALGIAAAGFATAALMIIMTLSKVSKMSDAEINQIGTNIKKVTTAILSSADQIIGLLAGLVRVVVETLITTTVTTIIASSKRIINGLISLCDILYKKAPELVNKLLQVAVEVLTQLEMRMGPLIQRVVSFIATFVSEVAKAITNNAPKIVNAINDVITAITTVVVGSIAKMLGLDEFKGAVNALIKIIKPLTAALLAMFAIKKFKKNADIIASVLKVLKGRVAAFKTGFAKAGIGNGWKEMLGINQLNKNWAYVTGKMKSEYKSLGQRMAFGAKTLAGAITVGAGIGLALGSLVKAFVDAKTNALDATTSWVEDTDKAFKDLNKRINKNIDDIKKRRSESSNAIFGIDEKYTTGESKLKRLMSIVDEGTGKIKEGKEKEAANIVKDLNSDLGVELVIENNILKMLNAQGEARKFELDQLKELVAIEQLREKVKEKQAQKEEIRKQIPDAEKNYKEAKTSFESAPTADVLKTGVKALADYYKRLQSGVLYAGTENERKVTSDDWLNFQKRLQSFNDNFRGIGSITQAEIANVAKQDGEFTKYLTELETKIKNNYNERKYTYDEAKKVYDSLYNELADIDFAERALETGENVKEANLVLSGIIDRHLDLSTTYGKTMAKMKADRALESIEDKLKDVEHTDAEEMRRLYERANWYYSAINNTEGLKKLAKVYDEYTLKWDKLYDANAASSKEVEKEASFTDELKDIKNVIKDTSKSGVDSGWGSMMSNLQPTITDTLSNGVGSMASQQTIDAAGQSLGAMFANSFSNTAVSSIGDKLFGGEAQNLWGSLANVLGANTADGLVSMLQSTIFPAIAGLSGNSIPFAGVTPVNFGLNQNGSGIYGTTVPLDGALPYDAHLTNITAILQMHSENMMVQTNTIITEIGLLRSDVTALGAHIDDMELRLDGDALVGGITQRMNDSLMRLSSRTERGL